MPTNSSRAGANATTAVTTVAVVACVLSAGFAPATDAARGALDPVDFARDYVAARARLEDGRGAPPPDGEVANARARRLGAPPAVLLGAIYYIHPPPAVLPVLALARLPWRGAALAWAALSLLALGWLAISLLTIAAHGRAPPPTRVALATAGLALWPPVLHCLEKGQWSIGLAALLASGFCALEAGRARRAGALFGLAAAFKLTPIVLAGVLLARHRRAATAMLLTFALVSLAAVAADGLAPWRAFLGGAARNATVWAAWTANTASLAGVYARLFGGGPFARPILDAPALASAAFNATALALLGAALYATRIRAGEEIATRATPDRVAAVPALAVPVDGAPIAAAPALAAAVVAAWLTFPVLLNPLGWTHVLVMLLVPLAVAARDGGRRDRWLALVVFALFSIPRQTLARIAGPLPVSPARGLALGLHAFAALALFVTLLAVARAARATPDSRRSR